MKRGRNQVLDMIDEASMKFRTWQPDWGPCPSVLAGLDYSVIDEAVELVGIIDEDVERLQRAGFDVVQAARMGACHEVLMGLRAARAGGDR